MVAIVVLAGSGIGFVLAHLPGPPVLSLSGGRSVTPGSALSAHGSGFSPGGIVIFSRDQGLSLLSNDRIASGNPSFAGQADVALQVPSTRQSNAKSITTTVRNDGTFDVTIVVREDWSPGSHTLHATDENTSRRADRAFTIIPMPAKLAVSTPLLDFGKLEKGNKPVRSVAVTNTGQQRLTWNADIGNTSWLKLQSKAGAIELSGSQEFIYVTADTTSLQVGGYSGTIRIKSNGGNALVAIQLQVVSTVPKQARLAVTPTTLDFGQLQAGQQSTLNVAVGNGGTDVLNWTANTGNASWLALYPATGTVKPGAVPQIIQVTANTANLLPGNYSATLQISSNGGIISVQVILVVPRPQSPPQPQPTPQPPKPMPPVLLASPSSFSTPGDSNCSYQANAAWICTAWLSSYKTAQTNLNWSASSDKGAVTFTPSHGVLSAGQTTKVTIAIPNGICPSQAAFTFKGPRNSADVLWFCRAPAWTFSPGMIKADKDCQNTANAGWTCSGVLAETPGSEGNLKWTASSVGLDGIKFKPSSGTLSPNRPVQVTISVVKTQCPASAILNFSASGVIPIAVPWRCGGGTTRLMVDPDSLHAYSDCPGNDDRGWTCKVTLRSDSQFQGKLTWYASADSGLSGVNFDPPSGTLAPGQRVSVTIFVPGDDDNCINSSFRFIGSDNIATVQWHCEIKLPRIRVSPDRLSSDASSNCAANDYGWLCKVTVEPADGAQSNLDWSAQTGLDGVIFTPSVGTVPPGGSKLVTILIPNSACRDSVFTFAGQGLNNSADVTWYCSSHRILTPIPKSLSAKDTSNCTPTDTGWNCTIHSKRRQILVAISTGLQILGYRG